MTMTEKLKLIDQIEERNRKHVEEWKRELKETNIKDGKGGKNNAA